MKRFVLSLFALPLLLINQSTFAQQPLLHCGNTVVWNKMISEHPEILQIEQQEEDFTQKYVAEHANDKSNPAYTIPVVFHIMHNFGPENISDAQVYDAMRVLNNDFHKLNPDTANTIPIFRPIAANCNIEFVLARKDPNGNCTNGIDRIQSMLTFNANDNSKLNQWPPDKYLNVWVVYSIAVANFQAAAYTYVPSTAEYAPQYDGILACYNYVGSIGAGSTVVEHTISHEVGHFFNLLHPWGSTNQPGYACGDDGVSDTPITEGWETCDLSGSVCSPPTIENVQNFMEYSYCSTMFTNGQKTRMYAALNSSIAARSSLWTTANLIATGTNNATYAVCAPQPVILPKAPVTICAGGTTTLQSMTINGEPTSWLWNLPGASPSTSTDSFPTVTYKTPGVYGATLTTSNAAGSNTTTMNNVVMVLSDSAQVPAATFYQNFENFGFPNTDNGWIGYSTNNNNWQLVNTVGYSGTHSLELNNSGNCIGLDDYFYTPTFDLSGLTDPIFYFRIAFAKTDTTDDDMLRIFSSIDCGKTWIMRYGKGVNNLATTSEFYTGNFVPALSQWRQDEVNLAAVKGQTDVRLKFDFYYDGGNNIYIDDINFNQPTSVADVNLNRDISLSVFPNPTDGKHFAVSFNLLQPGRTNISLVSIEGKEFELMNQQLDAGHQLLYFNPSELTGGIYFIKLVDANNQVYTQRIVIQ